MPMLEFDNVEVFYGKVQALCGISLTVEEGEIVALLGNNGAGKTTTLSTASALVRTHSGRVAFNGADITKAHPWKVVGAGLVHVPEGRRIFSTLTVLENLQLGGYLVMTEPSWPRESSASTSCFLCLRSARPSRGAPSPAASSKCWPSAAAWLPGRRC